MLARIEEMGRAQVEENRLFLKALLDPSARQLNPVPQYPSEPPTSKPQEPSELPTSEVQDPAADLRGPGSIGAADLRGPGAADLRAVGAADPRAQYPEPPTSEPSEPRIPEPSELRTSEPQEPLEPRIPEPQEPSEPPTSEPSEPRISEPREAVRAADPRAPGAVGAAEVHYPVALPTTPVPRDPSAEGRPWFPTVDMSDVSCKLTEGQFLCSICLDVFTDPCPNCNQRFSSRPELQVNTFISEMAAQFRQAAQQEASSSSSEQQAAKPGEVPCDVCTGAKLKALKSCLVCLESYCETHLEPHLTRPGLKRHQLMDPVENLEGRMCLKHKDKPLELFCKTDQTCVCMLCTVLDHKNHHVVPLEEECEGKKAEMKKTEAETKRMIQKRRLKIQELKHSVQLSEEQADREISVGVQVLTALKESVERSQAELILTTKEKHRNTEKQAEGFIQELEQELCELEKRSTEVKQLSCSEDHLHLLQSLRTLKASPPTKNWTGVRVRPPSYEGTVMRAVKQLEETLSKQMKKLFEGELKRVQRSAVDVTLDPDSANPYLILSDDGKQVKDGDVKKNLPDNPERFDTCALVLAKQSFSSGRSYYEVQVKGKTKWDLGVVRESINRKGRITMTPQNGFWTIFLRNENQYYVHTNPAVRLSLRSRPQKVKVLVDYEEGLVSFYDVDAAALIYTFTHCCFTEKLFPLFSPCLNESGKNSAPLIISPVNHME
ncbi:E3 ubiquitin-protein ligase TRIM21 [Liparis tanakae]|uniref:E3 ubiquitin-protein ligase TRIM21 n=1 Tax=Liparis tanakae TaxID=230148 RepID=A0A4Z2GQ06_9TELE|nr:E3 ubiquitin-protein ligase TRIM21 [Liparis tanakae]